MKILEKVSNNFLMEKYDYIVAWGAGPLFRNNYRKEYFNFECIIDGTGRQVGEEVNGICIKGVEYLKDLQGDILIIIYAIYEKEITGQIKDLNIKADTIIFSLVDIYLDNKMYLPQIYAKNAEDIMVWGLLQKLRIENLQFIEIGVCHPVIRNNTYLLQDIYSEFANYKGILVEANPLCWELIEEYRKKDKLIKKGIGEKKEKVPFYAFPSLLGHSTFVYDLAKEKINRGYEYEIVEIEMDSLNNIIKENFDSVPDLLAIDAEGLDFEIIQGWDYEKYPFKIIISEIMEEKETEIMEIMTERGYKIYAKTIENIIWLKSNLFEIISRF